MFQHGFQPSNWVANHYDPISAFELRVGLLSRPLNVLEQPQQGSQSTAPFRRGAQGFRSKAPRRFQQNTHRWPSPGRSSQELLQITLPLSDVAGNIVGGGPPLQNWLDPVNKCLSTTCNYAAYTCTCMISRKIR